MTSISLVALRVYFLLETYKLVASGIWKLSITTIAPPIGFMLALNLMTKGPMADRDEELEAERGG